MSPRRRLVALASLVCGLALVLVAASPALAKKKRRPLPPPPPPPAPTVEITKTAAVGEATPAFVSAVDKRLRSTYVLGLRRCYEIYLVDDVSLAGTMAARFRVGVDGHVGTIELKSAGLGTAMERCVGGMVKRWRFVGADAPVSLKVEARFAPPKPVPVKPR